MKSKMDDAVREMAETLARERERWSQLHGQLEADLASLNSRQQTAKLTAEEQLKESER